MKTINFAHTDYTPKKQPFSTAIYLLFLVLLVAVCALEHRYNQSKIKSINTDIAHLQTKIAGRTNTVTRNSTSSKKTLLCSQVIEYFFNLSRTNQVAIKQIEITKNKGELSFKSAKTGGLVALNQSLAKCPQVTRCHMISLSKDAQHFRAHYLVC